MKKNISKLIEAYTLITQKCEINYLGPPFTYYLADYLNNNLFVKNVLYLDLKSAYPSICQIYFDKDSEFIEKLNSLPNKLEKNKFIAINLKKLSEINQNKIITEFNILCKVLILGYTYSIFNNPVIIEYIKDGVIIKFSELNKNLDDNQKYFLNFINENNFKIHIEKILSYIRLCKNTSILSFDDYNNIIIKGKYKNIPEYIKKLILKFLEGEIYNTILLNEIRIIYSEVFSKIIFASNLIDEIRYYYSFDKYYLNKYGKLSDKNEFNNEAYLNYIIYPILSMIRLNSKGF